jgi:outer membrane protein TolC
MRRVGRTVTTRRRRRFSRKRSTVKFDEAQRGLDLYAYLGTIQTAMQGVANGLLDYTQQREAVAQQILLTASTREYASLASLRYTGGVGFLHRCSG